MGTLGRITGSGSSGVWRPGRGDPLADLGPGVKCELTGVTARVTGPEPAASGLGREKEDKGDRTSQEQEEGAGGARKIRRKRLQK